MSPFPTAAPLLPRVIGHRGAAKHAPENTLASFRKAAQLGTRWVEFDVRLTADGRCVLMHDDTLDRTTDGQGLVSAMELAEIAAFDAGGWFAPEYLGEAVPTLEEAIDLLGELNLGANVEIKAEAGLEVETARAVADILASSWPSQLPPPLVSSFQIEALRGMSESAPGIARGLLLDAVSEDWAEIAGAVGAVTIHCDHVTLTAEQARQIRASGFPLLCYTVNRPERAGKLLQWGVTGIISDAPDRILPVARV
jgi:glycerophosphoryl diester phosphodiesterase